MKKSSESLSQSVSHVQLFVTPWTVACQAPLSMEFSRQEPGTFSRRFPSPGNLPNPGMKPGSPELQANSLPFEPPGKPTLKVGEPKLILSKKTGGYSREDICANEGIEVTLFIGQ